MTLPNLRREKARLIGGAGVQAERHLARRLGGRLMPNSGAVAGAKGDMTAGCFLIEAKSTVRGSLGLKFAWLAKIAREARMVGRKPALAVTFTTGDGRPIDGGRWVLIPEAQFNDLIMHQRNDGDDPAPELPLLMTVE